MPHISGAKGLVWDARREMTFCVWICARTKKRLNHSGSVSPLRQTLAAADMCLYRVIIKRCAWEMREIMNAARWRSAPHMRLALWVEVERAAYHQPYGDERSQLLFLISFGNLFWKMTPQVVCTRISSGRDKCPWVIGKEATAHTYKMIF